jgi:hypothetical protein
MGALLIYTQNTMSFTISIIRKRNIQHFTRIGKKLEKKIKRKVQGWILS